MPSSLGTLSLLGTLKPGLHGGFIKAGNSILKHTAQLRMGCLLHQKRCSYLHTMPQPSQLTPPADRLALSLGHTS